MPGIEASEFSEPLGCTATPLAPPLSDSELKVASNNTGLINSAKKSFQKLKIVVPDSHGYVRSLCEIPTQRDNPKQYSVEEDVAQIFIGRKRK